MSSLCYLLSKAVKPRGKPTRRQPFSWFKLNRALHRDIGYFCIGLTLVFGLSGIAVNHIDDWNPNYRVDIERIAIPKAPVLSQDDAAFDTYLSQQLPADLVLKTTFWESPNRYKLFFRNNVTATALISEQQLIIERVEVRPIFRQVNFLHLNEAKRWWVWVSDIYAGLLMYLALSALFMVKGKKGVWGRRSLFVIAGFAVPIGFVIGYGG